MEIERKARGKYQQQDYRAFKLREEQREGMQLLTGLELVSTVSLQPFLGFLFVQPRLCCIEHSQKLLICKGPKGGEIRSHK